ncbi:MAG TPA: cation transporter, partial [Proteiniphilum sp.]|nr:cation transporter [Proteiniphilum sp.]
ADSLDMLADSLVYGLALFAVGGSALRKKNIARTAGYLQLLLALTGVVEVIRRFVGVTELPDFRTMMVISFLALIANAISLYILQKEKSRESHIQASMIFTSNDIVINIGVIVAALLVDLLQSAFPDLVIGAIVFAIVVRGAFRILRLAI